MKVVSPEDKIKFISKITKSVVDRNGENISISCPFCNNSNKNKLKLVIHIEKGYYHCWVCDKKGSDVSFLVKKINPSFYEESKTFFIKKSTSKFNLNIDLSCLDNTYLEIEEQKIEKEQVLDFPDDFDLLATNFNSKNPNTKAVFNYALSRGINKHKMWLLKLGFSNNARFKRQLIIPSFDEEGEINFYTARKIDAETSDPFKYNNASVKKKNIIFNELLIDWNKELTIVEGPLDLLKTNDNATCLLGSSLTEDMPLFNKIVKNKTKINLALDADVYPKTVHIANMLSSYDIEVKIVDTRSAKDVGDMTIDHFKDILLNKSKKFSKDDYLINKIKKL